MTNAELKEKIEDVIGTWTDNDMFTKGISLNDVHGKSRIAVVQRIFDEIIAAFNEKQRQLEEADRI